MATASGMHPGCWRRPGVDRTLVGMSISENVFHDLIEELRAACPDRLRRVLKSPNALILPLIDTAGRAVTCEDVGEAAEVATPRLGALSRSQD
jgi:hypothetical protein